MWFRISACPMAETVFSGPQNGQPDGVVHPEQLLKSSWIFSSGVSSTMLISWRMTCRSRSMSAGSKREFRKMSARMSERRGEVLPQHPCVKTGVLLPGKRVRKAADGVQLLGDLRPRPVTGPLENHVLDEVGDAVFLGIFIPGSRVHPEAQGDGSEEVHLFRYDPDTIFQRRFTKHRPDSHPGPLFGKAESCRFRPPPGP